MITMTSGTECQYLREGNRIFIPSSMMEKFKKTSRKRNETIAALDVDRKIMRRTTNASSPMTINVSKTGTISENFASSAFWQYINTAGNVATASTAVNVNIHFFNL